MIISINNQLIKYDMEKLSRVFFPFEKITFSDDLVGDELLVDAKVNDDELYMFVSVYGKTKTITVKNENIDIVDTMSVLLYKALSEVTNNYPQWGILTGVRPAKVMHKVCENLTPDEAVEDFENRLLVTPKKALLAKNVMLHENKIIALSKKNSYSLYVSIPFCPSRCLYCSFVSHSIERTKKLIEPYLDLLVVELEKTAKIAKELNLNLETIYFGGGTPTTLSAVQLKKLLVAIKDNFDLSHLREYTVESGRPDTITKDKLLVLKEFGVSRISINPQTFNDDVLLEIGRRHTSQQTVDAFQLARDCGFNDINMDFIAGLPKEDLNSFKNSIDKGVELGAESITVHSLSMKTASYMNCTENEKIINRNLANDMVDYSNEKLSKSGYYPYYMYRQSKTVGNLENVGWCKDKKDCLYNVFMMDETHSVFAVGAGAVTKLRQFGTNYIERIYNFKYPYEYIDHFDEMINRKEGIIKFYNEYNK